MDPFIGEIKMVGFNYAPQGWALCNGQLLPISQNQALFSLLGTNFGGDGRTNFGLPDLRGRTPMHYGQGPGLTPRQMGQKGGQEAVMLSVPQMPSHSHSGTIQPNASTASADKSDPTGAYPAVEGSGRETTNQYAGSSDTQMGETDFTTSSAGGSQAHDNMSPYQVVSFCIALQGVYPPRS